MNDAIAKLCTFSMETIKIFPHRQFYENIIENYIVYVKISRNIFFNI